MASGWDWPTEEFKNDPEKLKLHKEQRAANGFSVFDWWSFDTYIAGVIGNAVAKFRDDGVGFPGNMTEESFATLCTEISEPLLDYAGRKFTVSNEEEQEIYEKAIEAMHKFSEVLGHWWD